eukprot:scaffold25164_cov63-Phaeocystis_antarctica.AAC.1
MSTHHTQCHDVSARWALLLARHAFRAPMSRVAKVSSATSRPGSPMNTRSTPRIAARAPWPCYRPPSHVLRPPPAPRAQLRLPERPGSNDGAERLLLEGKRLGDVARL